MIEELKASLQGPAKTLTIQRSNNLDYVVQSFRDDPTLVQHKIFVRMMDEDGIDAGGVRRDMYASFWMKASQLDCFGGDATVIPYVTCDKKDEMEEMFRTLGAILSHTIATTKMLPPIFCSTTYVQIGRDARDKADLPHDILMEDFLQQQPEYLRTLFTKATESFATLSDSEISTLNNTLATYGYQKPATVDKIRAQLLLVAENVMLRKTEPFARYMREGIPDSHKEIFWSKLEAAQIKGALAIQEPNVNTIMETLITQPDVLSPNQEVVLNHFEIYLRGLSSAKMRALMMLITGLPILPRAGIELHFNNESSDHLPVMHTCFRTIDLPGTYETYDHLSRNMDWLLRRMAC